MRECACFSEKGAVMHSQTRIIEDPQLSEMLHKWASRYSPSESEQAQLIEQTIRCVADEVMRSPDHAVERTLFSLMHRIAQARVSRPSLPLSTNAIL